MRTSALTHDDLFTNLDSALIAIEFAHITGDQTVEDIATAEVTRAIAEALGRGYILDAYNCTVGDEVQNLHGDTGVITHIDAHPLSPKIRVCWDAPTPHPDTFGAAALTSGHLSHRR